MAATAYAFEPWTQRMRQFTYATENDVITSMKGGGYVPSRNVPPWIVKARLSTVMLVECLQYAKDPYYINRELVRRMTAVSTGRRNANVVQALRDEDSAIGLLQSEFGTSMELVPTGPLYNHCLPILVAQPDAVIFTADCTSYGVVEIKSYPSLHRMAEMRSKYGLTHDKEVVNRDTGLFEVNKNKEYTIKKRSKLNKQLQLQMLVANAKYAILGFVCREAPHLPIRVVKFIIKFDNDVAKTLLNAAKHIYNFNVLPSIETLICEGPRGPTERNAFAKRTEDQAKRNEHHYNPATRKQFLDYAIRSRLRKKNKNFI